MDWEDRITADPNVLVGKAVIKGTRLAVEFIIDLFANGWSVAQILDNYPGITHEDITACLKYANELVKSERVFTPTALQPKAQGRRFGAPWVGLEVRTDPEGVAASGTARVLAPLQGAS